MFFIYEKNIKTNPVVRRERFGAMGFHIPY
jgi:hypothetical protein